jgi:hypothetical protein
MHVAQTNKHLKYIFSLCTLSMLTKQLIKPVDNLCMLLKNETPR